MLPELTPLNLWIDGFRLAYLLAGIGGAALLWRKPRAWAAAGLVLALNLLAWAAYVAPLERLYGLDEQRDRAVNVATAATVAAGNSAWEGAQVGYTTHEPFWDVLLAALALMRPERVVHVYQLMTPLSIVAVALGLYLGLRLRPDEADAWECAMVMLAVLGLSSSAMSEGNPLAPFWAGNFLIKPNHASAIGLAGVALGLAARRTRWWILGLVLGLLGWVFVLTWALVVLGLALAVLLQRPAERDLGGPLRAIGLSLLVVSPDLLNLLRDFSPAGAGRTPDLVWREMSEAAVFLARPIWVIADLGPLLVLAVLGAWVMIGRRTRRDTLLLALLAAAWLWWAGSAATAIAGRALEPDEVHYFVRLAMAVCAGAALAAAARHLERWRALAPGQGHLLVIALCWPLTLPAYWDPSADPRYAPSLAPIGADEQDYARWVRENTPGDAVFLAGPSAATWIGVLSGRRVLLSGDARPPADYERRKEAEQLLLTSLDPEVVRRVARQMGIDYLAIDSELRREYSEPLPRLGESEVYERAYANPGAVIWRVRGPRAP